MIQLPSCCDTETGTPPHSFRGTRCALLRTPEEPMKSAATTNNLKRAGKYARTLLWIALAANPKHGRCRRTANCSMFMVEVVSSQSSPDEAVGRDRRKRLRAPLPTFPDKPCPDRQPLRDASEETASRASRHLRSPGN